MDHCVFCCVVLLNVLTVETIERKSADEVVSLINGLLPSIPVPSAIALDTSAITPDSSATHSPSPPSTLNPTHLTPTFPPSPRLSDALDLTPRDRRMCLFVRQPETIGQASSVVSTTATHNSLPRPPMPPKYMHPSAHMNGHSDVRG